MKELIKTIFQHQHYGTGVVTGLCHKTHNRKYIINNEFLTDSEDIARLHVLINNLRADVQNLQNIKRRATKKKDVKQQ